MNTNGLVSEYDYIEILYFAAVEGIDRLGNPATFYVNDESQFQTSANPYRWLKWKCSFKDPALLRTAIQYGDLSWDIRSIDKSTIKVYSVKVQRLQKVLEVIDNAD